MTSRRWLMLLPLALFAGLTVLFLRGLEGDPSRLPSALIGKMVPEFQLPAIPDIGAPAFDAASLRAGGVSVVNVWASWCVPCRTEHPLLAELARRSDIRLFGINYKDEPENARKFLQSLGQPFAAIVSDAAGRAAFEWGVYGVPETYVVDGAGFIRHKQIGPLTPQNFAGFVSEIEKAKLPLK